MFPVKHSTYTITNITRLPDKIKRALGGKRLIFSVSTGRSGTAYLSKILGYIPNVSSHHEPKPSFSKVLRAVQQNKKIAYDFWIAHKLPVIAKEAAPIYIETSHLLCKGFLEPLLDLEIVPDLIVLKRPHRQVSLSFCRFGTIPGRTAKGLKYLFSPSDPDVLSLPSWQKCNDYQLCYWYCLEIERRSYQYKRLFSELGSRVVSFSLDEISTIEGFEALREVLNLERPDPLQWQSYLRMRAGKVNTRSHLNYPATLPEDFDAAEQDIRNMLAGSNDMSWLDRGCNSA
jgi:hypothetical protein